MEELSRECSYESVCVCEREREWREHGVITNWRETLRYLFPKI